ncbi:hypothetical protein SpAn4DRAFT_2512 [Sporomusa ovata]|uniref:Uncharacterized protein n=1 Tax=Sporomusa ovata TaxID=2378 RepID=A0A0U1L0S6_9FIRM|nr:hypothetical protein SpAn4DRAFT_2512 [Sporomusa ovata]
MKKPLNPKILAALRIMANAVLRENEKLKREVENQKPRP